MFISPILLTLLGCRSNPSASPEDTSILTDFDGDGYATGVDCDDTDGLINPGAVELCDGVDNDCSGVVDDDADDAETFYADADSDGYGDPAAAVVACAAPSGTVADATDCDDTDDAIHPGADELCNDVDDDCDGTIDEDDAIDAPTWYIDSDSDGYGAEGSDVVQCLAPAQGAEQGGDCDDEDARYHPGAAESCADPADYNCDGSVGYADDDGDGWAACEECDDADAAVHPGAEELCNDADDDCDGGTAGRGPALPG